MRGTLGLLVLALLVAYLAQAQNTVVVENVNCTNYANASLASPYDVTASFDMSTATILHPGASVGYSWSGDSTAIIWGIRALNSSKVAVWGVAGSAVWDRDLSFSVSVEYYNPDQSWTFDKYYCKARLCYNGYCWVEHGVFYKKIGEPDRVSRTITFTVPHDRAFYSSQTTFRANRLPDLPQYEWMPNVGPVEVRGYCTDKPTASTWPSCNRYEPSKNVVKSGSAPTLWKALIIDRYSPGSVVRYGGANATVPNSWYYTDWHNNELYPRIGVSTDADPVLERLSWVSNKPFNSRITISGHVSPTDWGAVSLSAPKPVPLYVSRVVMKSELRDACPGPPGCFLIDMVGNSTWVGDRWVWKDTLASIAQRTGVSLTPYLIVKVADFYFASRDMELDAPLGSAYGLSVAVTWLVRTGSKSTWIGSGVTRPRAVDGAGNLLSRVYEEAGAEGKLAYESDGLATAGWIRGPRFTSVSFGIDGSHSTLQTAWFSPPNPCEQENTLFHCVYSQHVFTKVNGTWVGYAKVGPQGGVQFPINKLRLVDWIVPSETFISGRTAFFDFMSAAVGDPYIFFDHYYNLQCWAFNPSTGDFDIESSCPVPGPHSVSLLSEVYGVSQYKNTTDERRLYQQTASGVSWKFYNYAFEKYGGGEEHPAGWTDALPLGVPSMASNSTSPWYIFIVPATACDGTICTASNLNVRLWGPAPGPTADAALPGAGYAFLVVYIGNETETDLKIYVEKGILVDSAMGAKKANWDLLVHIPKRRWEPLDAAYVGYGWYRDYTALDACQSQALGRVGYYVAPTDWVGPVQLKLVDSRGATHFAFFVLPPQSASLRIEGRTETPNRTNTWQTLITAYLYVNGVPYFHGFTPFGEGGRQYERKCVVTTVSNAKSFLKASDSVSQLAAIGDFWGAVDMFARVRLRDMFVEPRFELLNATTGDVLITADGPVVGYAVYFQRGGSWSLVEVVHGPRVIIRASYIWPWDPALVVPIIHFSYVVEDGGEAVVYRPRPALLFKWWAEGGFAPYGTPSVIRTGT
ncbi:hypothetical protein [Pyrobaculum ferrireducens]|uniref:hypothetical protein n=1 Tax=Pyrobaculum ferrireducens TaxID=1104324 RepID=UPI0011E52371|nr:hypothetical protein [Pyrobaculum ferrireducens]